MAKTGYITLDPAEVDQYFSNLQPDDRLVAGKIRVKKTIFSRKRKAGVTQKSLLPQVAALWNGYTQEQKDAWSAAGAECNLNGWRLFVRDQCYRIKNDIVGEATPVILHQDLVGNLHIESPADEIKIAQYHPAFYWISHKVYGKKGMYEPVKVTEAFSLPLTIGLNYKADLTDLSAEHDIGKWGEWGDAAELNYFFYRKITMSEDGYLQAISFNLSKENAGDFRYSVGIFADNAGAVGAKIANTEIKVITGEYYDWVTETIHADLENGATYWLCVQTDNTAWDVFLPYDGRIANLSKQGPQTNFPDWRDNPAGLTNTGDDYLIYATYTEKPSFAKFYAEIWSSYQGRDILTNSEINLDYSANWKNAELVVSDILGLPIAYNLFIHLKNLQGDLFVDNIKAEHDAQNWARDPFCRDINQAFTRAFYQIPKHWAAEIMEEGAGFESIYPDD